MGRSHGGNTTKVHLIVDAHGLPVDFQITPGQQHDSQAAPELIERNKPTQLLADKAYDSDALREQLREIPCVAVIPPRVNRIFPAAFDKELYKARSAVECSFNLLKQSRRFATRYEKTLRNYAAIVVIACSMLWLRI